ncbi:MAG: hypothetical protein KF809_05105 [Chloroflexi bacterium]|nr:hypothetical protein [Chloroflexota bacterium]
MGVIVFQLALALGAPWGAYAMGGASPGRWPARLRVAAVVQAALLGVAAAIVLARAGLAFPGLTDAARTFIWLVVALALVALLLNAISRSAGERRLWVPVALVMLGSSLMVAITAS